MKQKLFFLIPAYFLLSLSLSFITKYFISENGYNFKFPVFKSGITNLMHAICSFVYLKLTNDKLSLNESNNYKYYLTYIIPCSFIGAFDIGISLFTLRSVELAFYTVLKSSTPVFILITGFLLGTETISSFSFISVITISTGTYLVTVKPTNTVKHQVYLSIISALVSGFRWSFIQFILNRSKIDQKSIFRTIQNLSAFTSVFLLSGSLLIFEGANDILRSEFFNGPFNILKNVFLLAILGTFSFLLIAIEFSIIDITSVLFLSVSSIFKELIIVGISILRKSTCMTKLNYIGICISILGLISYNILRYKK